MSLHDYSPSEKSHTKSAIYASYPSAIPLVGRATWISRRKEASENLGSSALRSCHPVGLLCFGRCDNLIAWFVNQDYVIIDAFTFSYGSEKTFTPTHTFGPDTGSIRSDERWPPGCARRISTLSSTHRITAWTSHDRLLKDDTYATASTS